MRAVTT